MKRCRVTAVIRTPKGFLVVSHSKRKSRRPLFLLPGGEIKQGETPRTAMCRELKEETRLGCSNMKHLFDTEDDYNKHSVFLLNTNQQPQKNMEINYLGYYTPGKGTNLRLGEHVRSILNMVEKKRANLSKIDMRQWPYTTGKHGLPFERLKGYERALENDEVNKYHTRRGR